MAVHHLSDDDREAFYRRKRVLENPHLELKPVAGRQVLGYLTPEEIDQYIEIADMQVAVREATEDAVRSMAMGEVMKTLSGNLPEQLFSTEDDAIAYFRTCLELSAAQPTFMYSVYARLNCWMYTVEVADDFAVVVFADRSPVVKRT